MDNREKKIDIIKHNLFLLRPRIRLTAFCNQNCKYCFAVDYLSEGNHKREMELSVLERILQCCKNEKIDVIAWQGGEPTLHSKLPEIVALHKKYNIKAMIFTNGIAPTIVYKQIQDIVFSVLVNCNSPETYNKENRMLLFSNIQLMQELYGADKVAIGINIHSPDMNTSFFVDYVNQLNIKEVRIDITRPSLKKENTFIDFDEIGNTFRKALNLANEIHSLNGVVVHFDCPIPLCALSEDEQSDYWSFMYDSFKTKQCRSSLDITTDGDITSCFCSIPFNRINLKEFHGLYHAHLFIRSIEDEIRWNRYTLPVCKKCIHQKMRFCQGGCLGYKVQCSEIVNLSTIYDNQELINSLSLLSEARNSFLNGEYCRSKDLCNACNISENTDLSFLKRKLILYNDICQNISNSVLDSILNYISCSYQPILDAIELVSLIKEYDISAAITVAKYALQFHGKELPHMSNCFQLYSLLAKLYHNTDHENSVKCLLESYNNAPKTMKERFREIKYFE